LPISSSRRTTSAINAAVTIPDCGTACIFPPISLHPGRTALWDNGPAKCHARNLPKHARQQFSRHDLLVRARLDLANVCVALQLHRQRNDLRQRRDSMWGNAWTTLHLCAGLYGYVSLRNRVRFQCHRCRQLSISREDARPIRSLANRRLRLDAGAGLAWIIGSGRDDDGDEGEAVIECGAMRYGPEGRMAA
jgi:hypothetical protein